MMNIRKIAALALAGFAALALAAPLTANVALARGDNPEDVRGVPRGDNPEDVRGVPRGDNPEDVRGIPRGDNPEDVSGAP